ncbi:NUDIX hydrolase [Streptomyces mobaraensis]|uniref:NUDIX hydrolase n=2 Tax=Streptomyces mobaraensis TaxID=35621 RepID=A0A5N5W4F3_STRMB|nr:NUDIX hydrolase [Streptomyces mobaraensis]
MTETHTRIGASAAAIVTDSEGRVLIVNPLHKPRWNLPGGRINAGELPRAALARELQEELGLDLPIGDLLVHAYVQTEGDGHAYYVFDAPTLTPAQQASIRLQEDELGEFRFVEASKLAPQLIPPHALAAWKATLLAREEQRVQFIEVEM